MSSSRLRRQKHGTSSLCVPLGRAARARRCTRHRAANAPLNVPGWPGWLVVAWIVALLAFGLFAAGHRAGAW